MTANKLEPFAPVGDAAFVRQMIIRNGPPSGRRGIVCCACRERPGKEKIPIGGVPLAVAGVVAVCSARCAYLVGRWLQHDKLRREAGGAEAFDLVSDQVYDQIAARFHLVPVGP